MKCGIGLIELTWSKSANLFTQLWPKFKSVIYIFNSDWLFLMILIRTVCTKTNCIVFCVTSYKSGVFNTNMISGSYPSYCSSHGNNRLCDLLSVKCVMNKCFRLPCWIRTFQRVVSVTHKAQLGSSPVFFKKANRILVFPESKPIPDFFSEGMVYFLSR